MMKKFKKNPIVSLLYSDYNINPLSNKKVEIDTVVDEESI